MATKEDIINRAVIDAAGGPDAVKIAQLEDEIERLRAALAFYAAEINWAECSGNTSAAVEDGGKIARRAYEQSRDKSENAT